jgi:hypothetical protein
MKDFLNPPRVMFTNTYLLDCPLPSLVAGIIPLRFVYHFTYSYVWSTMKESGKADRYSFNHRKYDSRTTKFSDCRRKCLLSRKRFGRANVKGDGNIVL